VRAGVAAVQVDEPGARQPRSKVVAARTDALEKPAPAITRLLANCELAYVWFKLFASPMAIFLAWPAAWVTFRARLPAGP
jgi:hypothetical protein